MDERRRVPRFELRLKIEELNGRRGVEAQLLDVSPLGVRIRRALPYEPADLVEFSFLLPGDRRETRLQGEVVWLDFAQTTRGYYTMGVSLLHPHWRLGQLAQC